MIDDGDAMVDNGDVTIDETCASAKPDTMPIYIPHDLPKMIPQYLKYFDHLVHVLQSSTEIFGPPLK